MNRDCVLGLVSLSPPGLVIQLASAQDFILGYFRSSLRDCTLGFRLTQDCVLG